MNRFFSVRVQSSFIRLCSRSTSTKSAIATRDRKRFYKKVSVNTTPEQPNRYEIFLDKRQLKTPSGNVVRIENEFLALALAQEWNQQLKKIDLPSMHLYSLMNTLIDNPLKLTKTQLIEKMMHFLDWDTLLYRSDHPEEFRQLQIKSWDPILSYINEQFHTNLQSTYDLNMKDLITKNDRAVIENYLMNFDQPSLIVLSFIVEQIKSVLLTICLIKQYRAVEDIAILSRLETEFQISRWNNVEYYHDYDMMDTCSKVSAAYLTFYCLNNNTTRTVTSNMPVE